MSDNYDLFSVLPAEYGFLFSFGGSGVLPHFPAQPIIFIHIIIPRIQIPTASKAHQSDSPSQKCRISKITAGTSPSKFSSILIKRHIKKLLLRLVLRIFRASFDDSENGAAELINRPLRLCAVAMQISCFFAFCILFLRSERNFPFCQIFAHEYQIEHTYFAVGVAVCRCGIYRYAPFRQIFAHRYQIEQIYLAVTV